MSESYRAIADLFGAFTNEEKATGAPIKAGKNADESDQLGRLSLEAGKYSEAIEHFRRAVEQRDPNDVSSRIDLAGALESADEFPAAYRQYIKALDLKSDELEPHAGIADLLKRHGKFRESLEHLKIALEKEPANVYFNFKMAETLREAGAPKGLADRAGILLHGRSRTKQEMLDLTAALDFGGTRWLAPYAGKGLWYPGRYYDPIEANEPQLTRSVERTHWLVLDAAEGGRLGGLSWRAVPSLPASA